MRQVLLLSFLMAACIHAGAADDPVTTAAFRLGMAYQCAPIIGNDAPYEWAKKDAAALLSAAGTTSPTVEELVSKIQAEGRDGVALDKSFCETMLANFK